MAFIADEKKLEIRERIRLEDLVQDYNIPLQSAGGQGNGRRLRALCPFHPEKTPSFHVNVENQFFHCFGCNASGDIFTFLQRIENVNFPEALEMLARKAGVVLEPVYNSSGKGLVARSGLKTAIYEALSLAQDYYHQVLVKSSRAEPARQYLTSRGIRKETWERFSIGYSLPGYAPPNDGDSFMKIALKKGITKETLEKAGLIRVSQQSTYDYFRGRVMFPIADGQKRIVGFGARTLGDDQPKYLNTPKTAVFDKSLVLYGLPQARASIEREKRIAIVEGYTDVVAAHQEKLEYFVASLGTAFTADNARRLKRLAPRADIIFDGDVAGQSAAERSLSLLVSEEIDVRVLTLAKGEDPFDSLMKEGGEKFRNRLEEEALGIFEFKWRCTVGSLEPSSNGAGDIARALDEVLDLLMKVPNVIARKLHAKEFAEKLAIPPEDIEKRLRVRSSRASRMSPGRRPVEQSFPEKGSPEQKSRFSGRAIPNSERGGMPSIATSTTDEFLPKNTTYATENPSLAEVIIETLLLEPDTVGSRWQELPLGFFEDPDLKPELKSIAVAVYNQIQGGGLDVERLVGFIDDPNAVPLLACILSRIEQKSLYSQSSKWRKDDDTNETWDRCLKEIERNTLLKRRREVVTLQNHARAAGDLESLLSAEREYRELLRKIAHVKQKGL